MLAHLRAQGEQSYDSLDRLCRYRGPNGTKCAVGCLIPDEMYHHDMEGLIAKNPIIYNTFGASKYHDNFLYAAQLELHDRYHEQTELLSYPTWLELQAKEFATKWNLNYA